MTSCLRQHTKKKVRTTSAICAIALNEERYIDEWIQYHLGIGFDHIYVYDNSDNYSLQAKKTDHVTIIHYPGKTKQLEAYDSFVSTYRSKYIWGAFIDIDEFIVLKQHASINEFLAQYHRCEAIGLNWLMFGTNHQTEYIAEPVTYRFTRCASKLNPHIKSIIQLQFAHVFNDPHSMILLRGSTYDTSHKPIVGSLHHDGKMDVACIHHYYSKSEGEFIEKINRGRADIIEKRSLSELDEIHSRNNDVINTDACKCV